MAFLGCSRGLGREVFRHANHSDVLQASLLMARNSAQLKELSQSAQQDCDFFSIDFSKEAFTVPLLEKLQDKKIQRVFYFAGGGPYGNFGDKAWKDHAWGLNVTLLAPMKLIHQWACGRLPSVTQVIVIGSEIADSKADAMAASYTVAKHGLKGLVTTIHKEKPELDLRLFRPGYMDTDLLPISAKSRLAGDLADPKELAKTFLSWALKSDGQKVFTPE